MELLVLLDVAEHCRHGIHMELLVLLDVAEHCWHGIHMELLVLLDVAEHCRHIIHARSEVTLSKDQVLSHKLPHECLGRVTPATAPFRPSRPIDIGTAVDPIEPSRVHDEINSICMWVGWREVGRIK
jgi:hypothetical protein